MYAGVDAISVARGVSDGHIHPAGRFDCIGGGAFGTFARRHAESGRIRVCRG
jgi:hypothetical protein